MTDVHVEAEGRRRAIAECAGCDEAGWVLGSGGVPVDPARKCDHAERVEDWRDR